MRPTVVIVGTLDTKAEELSYLRTQLADLGLGTWLVDVGTGAAPGLPPDVTRAEVARCGDLDLAEMTNRIDRGAAVSAMATAAARYVRRLYDDGRCHGVIAAGGSGNTTIATSAMRALPLFVPKVMVSTMASGNTSDYIGASDIVMIPAVCDVAGLNRISARVLASAASVIAAMVHSDWARPEDRRLISATMFGVTTAAVDTARAHLAAFGYEVITFHATGAGGRSMEELVESGQVDGVLDVTTTELADELVGGILSAGPDRLHAAGRRGIPQVVSVGALDMVNFGPRATVPDHFTHRRLLEHNPQVTLMRTTPEECAQLGAILAERLSTARGPAAVFLPLRGISQVSVAGGPFWDPDADDALFRALRTSAKGTVEIHEIDTTINDPRFAIAMADRLHDFLGGTS